MRRFSVAPSARHLPPPLVATVVDRAAEVGAASAPAVELEAAVSDDDAPLQALQYFAGNGSGIDAGLLTAFAAASAPNSVRALLGDLRAFADWCRDRGSAPMPATPPQVAAYLRARHDGVAGKTPAAPAALTRYKASIARLHLLAGLPDPTRDPLVMLTLKALRRERGTVQRQARPLRFKGAVRNVHADAPRGLSLAALLDGCGGSALGLRDKALLSVAYDTGLRAAELVALDVADLLPAIDAQAGLISVRRSKSDQEGQGATAYLSPRSMRALRAWFDESAIEDGPLFRRVFVRRMSAKAAIAGERWARIEGGLLRTGRLPDMPAVAAHTRYTIGREALTAAAVTGIYRRAMTRAYSAGALPDLDAREFADLVAGVSAHSTRVGLTQDLFSAGEDLAGIMDALRWKTARMPLLYNRNLAAESGAAGRVVGRL